MDSLVRYAKWIYLPESSTLNIQHVQGCIMPLRLYPSTVYFSDIIASLSYALDLTEGQPPGHSLRCCWIGMHIGDCCELSEQQKFDLYYTLLLKDIGCSSNAARLCALYGSDDRLVKEALAIINGMVGDALDQDVVDDLHAMVF